MARPRHLANFVWRNPRGEVISDTSKYVMTVEDFNIRLLIKNVTINDMGAYPFEVSVVTAGENRTRTERLVLVVNQRPVLSLATDKSGLLPFYVSDKKYSATCDITSYPLDKNSLQFYFYPCDPHPHQNR